jgi:hypothetical protein
MGEVGYGPNKVYVRIGLREVYSAVQKSSLRKLARFRENSPAGKHRLEYFSDRYMAPVAIDLRHILARIRMRFFHIYRKNLVNHCGRRRFLHISVIDFSIFERADRGYAGAAKQFAEYFLRAIAADPYNAYRALARSGRYSGYGVAHCM